MTDPLPPKLDVDGAEEMRPVAKFSMALGLSPTAPAKPQRHPAFDDSGDEQSPPKPRRRTSAWLAQLDSTPEPPEQAKSDHEEDYMTMGVKDERPLSRIEYRARKKLETEVKSHPKSKKELEFEAAQKRERGLETALDDSNKGFRMLKKLGYQPGIPLGQSGSAENGPIRVSARAGTIGIGARSLKRTDREIYESEVKRQKAEKQAEIDFREHMSLRNRQMKLQKQLRAAQEACLALETAGDDQSEDNDENCDPNARALQSVLDGKPLKSVNVMWRDLLREQLDAASKDILFPTNVDVVTGRSDVLDISTKELGTHSSANKIAAAQADLNEPDAEQESFNNLPLEERLQQLINYMRMIYHYCFWCGLRYDDECMSDCPGPTEDDHL